MLSHIAFLLMGADIAEVTWMDSGGWRAGTRILQVVDLPIIFLADKCWYLFKAAVWMKESD